MLDNILKKKNFNWKIHIVDNKEDILQEEDFQADIRFKDHSSKRMPIKNEMSIGSNPHSDIWIEEHQLFPYHGKLRVYNKIIMFVNLAEDEKTKIGDHKLQQGKMYILNSGDIIKMGDALIIVRFEKEKEEDNKNEDTESTQSKLELDVIEKDDKTGEFTQSEVIPNLQANATNIMDVKDIKDISKIDVEEAKQEKLIKKPIIKARPKKNIENKLKPSQRKNIDEKSHPFFHIRIFALLTNINVSLLVAIIFKNNDLIKNINSILKPHFNNLINTISIFLPESVPKNTFAFFQNDIFTSLIAVFITLEIITPLIFGCSLGMYIIGVRNIANNKIVGRVKAIISGAIGIITLPFIIFDLPAIVGKPTLKESITSNKVHYAGLFKSIIGLILYLLLIGTILFHPFLINESLNQQTIINNLKKSKRANPINTVITSPPFGLIVVSNLKDDIIAIPSLKGNSGKMIFFSKNSSKEVSFNREKDIDLKDHISNIIESNPLLAIKSKNLDRKDIVNNIIKDAFNINKSDILPFIKNNGIFFTPYIELKNKVINELGIESIQSIDIIKNDASTFFIFSKNIGKKKYYIITALLDTTMHVYNINYENKSKNISNKVLSIFHDTSLIYKEEESLEGQLTEPFKIINIMDDAIKTGKISFMNIETVANYYKGFKDEINSALKSTVLKNLNSIIKYLEKSKNQSFHNFISSLKKAKDELTTKEPSKENTQEDQKNNG